MRIWQDSFMLGSVTFQRSSAWQRALPPAPGRFRRQAAPAASRPQRAIEASGTYLCVQVVLADILLGAVRAPLLVRPMRLRRVIDPFRSDGLALAITGTWGYDSKRPENGREDW